MIIHYYSLSWCSYGLYQENPAVFAPENTDEILLRQYHFHQTEDGRWYKFLTEKEYDIIIKNSSANIISFSSEPSSPPEHSPENRNSMKYSTANWLCIGSVLAFLLGLAPLFYTVPVGSEPELIMLLCPPFMWLTALILTAIVRIRCPENLFGKILMISYSLLILLAVIGIMLLIAACNGIADACFNCECIGSDMS